MRYAPEILDEIRARLPVSRIVERRVKLKRAGREYIGLSPFKTERSPSFTVNDHKGFYHCFATGEHGDIFTFVMQTEGLSFPEAVERLASEAGVILPEEKPRDEQKVSHEQRMREACEEACQFFERALKSDAGQEARAYLQGRGVTAQEIKTFRLGFALDTKTALKSYLAQKGFNAREMEESGLLIHGDDIPISYDRFRGRLIFPITDVKGRVIAFGGRALQKDQQPKYLNSPETPLFHKGRVLFNMAAARQIARTTHSVIVAEGYMDVIALTRAGFANAVAPLGTALTEDQLRLLWTMSPSPTLCFDGDAAGKKAAFRAVDVALPHLEPERSLQFVFLPEGLDPDDLLCTKGAGAIGELMERPTSFFETFWMREEAKHSLDTPESRASFDSALMEQVNQIQHKTLKYHYTSTVRERLRAMRPARQPHFERPKRPPQNADQAWRAQFQSTGFSAQRKPGAFRGKDKGQAMYARTESLLKSAMTKSAPPLGTGREALLIRAMMNHPWLLDEFPEDIAALIFEIEECRLLRNAILIAHQGEIGLDTKQLVERLLTRGMKTQIERVEVLATRNGDDNFKASDERTKVLEDWQHVLALQYKASVEKQALSEAEQDYLQNETDENFARICAIRQQAEIALS